MIVTVTVFPPALAEFGLRETIAGTGFEGGGGGGGVPPPELPEPPPPQLIIRNKKIRPISGITGRS